MIRKIRRRHRVIWVILAIILPILLIASVVFRHSAPVNRFVPQRNEITNKQ